MALEQKAIDGNGIVTSTLAVSKTGPLELTISAGSWVGLDASGNVIIYTIASPQSVSFTADPTDPTDVIVCLVYKAGGSPESDIWADEVVLDAPLMKDVTASHGSPPNGYSGIVVLAWFKLPAGATDLDQTTVYHLGVT